MVELKEISLAQLRRHIKIGFSGDRELLTKYHKLADGDNPPLLDDVVKDTYDTIAAVEEFNCEYYAVILNKICTIGYTVIGTVGLQRILYSFGIDYVQRNRQNLIAWFETVTEKMGQDFQAYLWDKNTRAIGFLEKNGMQVTKKENDFVALNYNF